MRSFLEFLQEDCGGYSLRDILDNLTEEQIEEAVQEYVQERENNSQPQI